MKRILSLVLLGLLITSCQKKSGKRALPIPPLYPMPISSPLNLEQGYPKNILTHTAVKPLLTPKRDTLPTGKPIPFKGTVLPLAKGLSYKLVTQDGRKVPAFTNQVLAKSPTI